MAEEEVLIEVEAAESVYGDDCVVIDKYPPHLHLQIKPRTADDSSQQFVEAVLGIHASSKYPDEPPNITIIESKGLDEQRQKHLITSIHNKACELSSNAMLVALCEEAVERLTSMNHPEGDCPLCLSPLVEDGSSKNDMQFMKLMSCFHCFHCECIIRWWKWLEAHNEVGHASSSRPEIKTQQDMQKNMEDATGRCPVCRKVFHTKDIEHVLDLVGAYSQLTLEDIKDLENQQLVNSDSENTRRRKFEAILKVQQENNGLIEPKKAQVLMPGMFLPLPLPSPAPTEEQHNNDPSNKPSSSNNHESSRQRRKHRGRNQRTQVNRQWIVKENGNAE